MKDNDKMIRFVKESVANYFNKVHANDKKYIGTLTPDDVYTVWFSKTIQNFKALASYDYPDSMYYEVTFHGDKKEAYMDCYKKVDKMTIPFDTSVDDYNNKWHDKNQASDS